MEASANIHKRVALIFCQTPLLSERAPYSDDLFNSKMDEPRLIWDNKLLATLTKKLASSYKSEFQLVRTNASPRFRKPTQISETLLSGFLKTLQDILLTTCPYIPTCRPINCSNAFPGQC